MRRRWPPLVPACPAWLVRDVVAHLCATAQDMPAGRLTRIATEAETAAQVTRFHDHDMAQILAAGQDVAPKFQQLGGTRTVWPAVLDIASREQDIRGAVGRPGARGAKVIWHGADWLLTRLRPPVALRVAVEDAEFRAGPQTGTELRPATGRFETFRWPRQSLLQAGMVRGCRARLRPGGSPGRRWPPARAGAMFTGIAASCGRSPRLALPGWPLGVIRRGKESSGEGDESIG